MNAKQFLPLMALFVTGCPGFIVPSIVGDWEVVNFDFDGFSTNDEDGELQAEGNGDAEMNIEFEDEAGFGLTIEVDGDWERDGNRAFDFDMKGELDWAQEATARDIDLTMSCDIAGGEVECSAEMEYDSGAQDEFDVEFDRG